MKRYIQAVISTILLVATPLIMIPFLQWYKKTWCEPNTDLIGVYMLITMITFGMFFLCIFKWISAIEYKDIKDL